MTRILVVDDAATVRMYHRGILEGAGYAVDEAVNGLEALEKVLVGPYDLYLVDINMPLLDGYGFLEALRGHDELPQAPAIMLSTEAMATDQFRGFEAGANLCFVKPVQPGFLLRHVRALVG